MALEQECDLKIILLGDSAVGKSKLVERFLMDQYKPRQLSTYALTVFRHLAKDAAGKEISIDFWDTYDLSGGALFVLKGLVVHNLAYVVFAFRAGQERFASMHPSYYYRAHACILVFDVTRKITYQRLADWFKELRQYSATLPVLVVANKIDINYEVTSKPFLFASKRNLPFVFCSAADGTNVVKTFEDAIQAALKFKENPGDDFLEQLLETVDYIDKKEKSRAEEEALQASIVPCVEAVIKPTGHQIDFDKEYM